MPDEWFTDCNGTPTAGPTMSLETSIIKRGSGAARMDVTTDPLNPTTMLYIRRKLVPGVNWIYADRIKCWMYRSGLDGIDGNGVDIRLIGDYVWTGTRYFWRDSLGPPASGQWKEFNYAHGVGWQRVNNPGDAIIAIEFRLDAAVNLGTGYVIIDKLHFVRDETAVTSQDATSQVKYGRRK